MKYHLYIRECALCTFSFSPLFKCGATASTNAANKEMNQATNETNRLIAEQTNEANIRMNTENNELQRQLQEEMNEYNSIQAQLERASQAGVNPNAVLGGNISGNLQSTLPSVSAGHAEIGAPMVAPHNENPFMERLETAQALNQFGNDFVNRNKTSAETDLTSAQAENQWTVNQYQNTLSSLGVQYSRKSIEKLNTDIASAWENRNLMIETANQVKASVANMNQDTVSKFLANYFSVEKRNSFIEFTRNHFDELGIPRNAQLSDNDLIAIRYGVIGELGVPMSQKLVNESQEALNRSSAGVQSAIKGFVNAQTQGQYISNALNSEFGRQERQQGLQEGEQRIEESKTRQGLNKANEEKSKQNLVIDSWKTSKWSQSQFAASVALDNAQKDANIDNTKVDTAKKVAETAESVTKSAANLSDAVNPLW